MTLFRLLGTRLARMSGRIVLGGLDGRVTIARDGWGIPHISVGNDADGWLGLGFCQGPGSCLSTGDAAPGRDRHGRRAGRAPRITNRPPQPQDRFRIAAENQLAALEPDLRAAGHVFAEGVDSGIRAALRRPRLEPWISMA